MSVTGHHFDGLDVNRVSALSAGSVSRRAVLAGAGLVILAGCAGSGSGRGAAAGSPSGAGSATSPGQGGLAGPSALDDPRAPGLPDPLIDTDRLISGGPGPDGIPSIDAPRFLDVGAVSDLGQSEAVLGIAIGTTARAYPIRIMIWHEIVNDIIAGVPVAVTYCPLCNSALAFDRRVEGRELTFGVSGLLYNSDLVMFDRQTESLWPQIEGRAVAGVLTGTELTRYTVHVQPWAPWRAAHPGGQVLSAETGYRRDYGRNPYPGYDSPGERPFLYQGDLDDRLPPKARVVAMRSGSDAMVIALDRVERDRVVSAEINGRPVVVLAGPPLASPLDDDRVADGTARISARVFDARAGGRRLRFAADGDGYRDSATGSRWDADGRALTGPLAGRALAPVEATETLWFAWIAFRPDSRTLM